MSRRDPAWVAVTERRGGWVNHGEERHVDDFEAWTEEIYQRAPRRWAPWALLSGVAIVVVAASVWAVMAFRGGADGSGTASGAPVQTPSATTATTTTPPVVDLPRPAVDRSVTAAAFLQAWERADYPAMQAQVADPTDDMQRVYGGMAERLGITAVDVTPGTFDAATSTLPYDVVVTLDSLGIVEWSSSVYVDPGGRVGFSSTTVYPGLVVGQRLELRRAAVRGDVVDRNGVSLGTDPDLTGNLVGRFDASGFGTSGLQRAFDAQLTGTGGATLVVADANDNTIVTTVKEWPGQPPPPLTTTLDTRVQAAAESAIAGGSHRSALVAVDIATGEVLASANNPVEGIPVALTGAYIPGSAYKIITAAAAIRSGLDASSTVDCPASVTAGGRTFRNASTVRSGPTSLANAFAVSCNTAFIGLASSVGIEALSETAASYGFGGPQPLAVASSTGTLPAPVDEAQAAADAIGLGDVTVSPLQMASVAAAVGSGTWHQPHVTACPECAAHDVPEAPVLQDLMRAAVTNGTASGLAGAPGGPVYGKTGTATMPDGGSHAWFVGWQGSVAFAVFIEYGGSGASAAVPVAGRFLDQLASG